MSCEFILTRLIIFRPPWCCRRSFKSTPCRVVSHEPISYFFIERVCCGHELKTAVEEVHGSILRCLCRRYAHHFVPPPLSGKQSCRAHRKGAMSAGIAHTVAIIAVKPGVKRERERVIDDFGESFPISDYVFKSLSLTTFTGVIIHFDTFVFRSGVFEWQGHRNIVRTGFLSRWT